MMKTATAKSTISNRFIKEKRVIQQLTNKDALFDAFLSLYNNTSKCQRKSFSDSRNKFIQLYKPVCHEINRSKLSLHEDFQLLHKDTYVEGAFGKVTIVKSNHDNTMYALKTLNKTYLVDQMDRSSPMEERLVLSNENEEWLPKLYCSFQDEKNLYLVMEYAHGGDLENLMERRQQQRGSGGAARFSEEEAKFYIAELILAVERIHQLGYIHRDIKPANILIDQLGHIKLGDLGSCISIDTKDPLLMVGTMPYISPEMCNSEGHDATKGLAYGPEVDWWSVGIVLYELIHGQPPFTGKDIQIQMSLVNPKISVQFPSPGISKDAKDLISKLLHKDKKNRLVDVQQIKQHPFFQDIDWTTQHTQATPPFIPPIKSQDDITFFASTPASNQEDEDEEAGSGEEEEYEDSLDKEFPFIGYTYLCSSLAKKKSPTATTASTATASTATDTQAFLAQYRQNRLSQSISTDTTDKLQLEIDRLKALLEEKDKSPAVESKEKAVETLNKQHDLEMKQLKELLDQRDVNIAKLKSDLEQQKTLHDAEIVELKVTRNSKNSASFDSRNKQIEELQSRIKVMESTNQGLESRNEALNSDNKVLLSRNEALESDNEELQSNNTKLESNIKDLTVVNQELQVNIIALENDKRELEVKIDQLESSIEDKDTNEAYLNHKNEELESKINNLANDKKELESTIEHLTSNKATANEAQAQQVLDLQQTIASLKKEIEGYHSNKPLLEKQRITSLEKHNSELNAKLLTLENQFLVLTNKLQSQSTDYALLLEQSKSECEELKLQLLQHQTQASAANKMIKRSNKSLPNIPISSSLPYLGPDHSPGEGRSLILSSMWQRDRDSLKSVQQALEESESKLAFAKRQVIRLKKEVKCFQKYTFEQQQEKNLASDAMKNMMDDGSHQHNVGRVPPITPAQKPFSPATSVEEDFDPEVTLLDKKLSSSINKKTNKVGVMPAQSVDDNDGIDAAILEEIEREKSFINSTKLTIAARSRLSRTKGEIDQELERSLEIASKRLVILESKVAGASDRTRFSSSKDYLLKKKAAAV